MSSLLQRLDDNAFALLLEMHSRHVAGVVEELRELQEVTRTLRIEADRRKGILDAAGVAVAATLDKIGAPGPG